MAELRNNWTRDEISVLFELPFQELMFQAQVVHRAHHDPGSAFSRRLADIDN